MPEITAYQSEILMYLKDKEGFISPTEIASKVGHYHSSSWASPKCLNLVKQGLLIRNNKGHYAIKK